MKVDNENNSIYITSDGIKVDDNDNESIIIYRPISKYMTLEDIKIINNLELPKLKTENLILKKDEFCCFIDNCNTFETKTVTTGYVSNRHGNSVRITKGFSLNAGVGESHAVKENRTNYYSGTIYITNKRIVYVSSGNDSFDKPIENISSVNELPEGGIIIQIGSKKHIIVFETHALFMTVLGIVKYKEFGTELPQALTDKNIYFTCDPYVVELYKKKENNLANSSTKSNVGKTKVNEKKTKYILWVIILLCIIAIIKALSSNYESYTDTQIINLTSHPKVFTDFYEAKSFYKAVDKKKVKVSSSHVYYEDDEKHLIYMEIDNSDKNIIDDIRLYLNTSSEYNGIDLNSAIKIALDYLPLDIINNYYDFYDSFKETIQNSSTTGTVYYYHWKIKDNARENNKNLSNEIGFKIFHNETDNTFKVYVGSLAVSIDDHVKYLDNKCDAWDVNINEYIEN